MVKIFNQFDILLIELNPTMGSEINKTRPCVVVSPDELNKYLNTIIVAPMTGSIKNYPTRVDVTFNEKHGSIVLDQIRTIDKSRVRRKIGRLEHEISSLVKDVLLEMFS